MRDCIEAAVERLSPLCGDNLKIGLILGSGLGDYAEGFDNLRTVAYADIPGFPQSSVAGHKGRFVVGEKWTCQEQCSRKTPKTSSGDNRVCVTSPIPFRR